MSIERRVIGNNQIVDEALLRGGKESFLAFRRVIDYMLNNLEHYLTDQDEMDFSNFSLITERDQFGIVVRLRTEVDHKEDDFIEAIKAVALVKHEKEKRNGNR